MEFTTTTDYDMKTLTARARALRKTVRKKRSRRAHIFGWIVVLLGTFLLLPPAGSSFSINGRTLLTLSAVLAILLTFFFEDRLNGYFARKRLLPGTESAVSVFKEDSYHTETRSGQTDWPYNRIAAIAELPDYFILILGENHAQAYDKARLKGGMPEEFSRFLEARTGLSIVRIS